MKGRNREKDLLFSTEWSKTTKWLKENFSGLDNIRLVAAGSCLYAPIAYGKFHQLSEKILEKYGSEKAFSEALGSSPSSLYKKMTGRTAWGWDHEVENACRLLGIPFQDADRYFWRRPNGNGR